MGRVIFMKCIIFSGFGVGRLPKEVTTLLNSKINEKGELYRLDSELISAIESLPWVSLTVKELRELGNITDEYVKILGDNSNIESYIFPSEERYIHTNTFSICEVDTTRKWGIEEYDGAESVVYFENLEPICEELNFYRKTFD